MLDNDRAQKRREELLLTQDDVANFIGVSAATVDNWERGFSNPKKGNLQALAKVLQTTTDYLEGNTDIETSYSSTGNHCIICGKSIPYGIVKCPDCCWSNWTESILTSEEQAKRRKRSHLVNLISLDRSKGKAEFMSTTSYGTNYYNTSLDMCTCRDFEERHLPCKHMYRLAHELGLFYSEKFAPGEDDYTLHFESSDSVSDYTAVPVDTSSTGSFSHMDSIARKIEAEKKSASAVPATPEIKTDKKPSKFLKFLKYIACCPMLFISIVCLLGAITRPNNTGKEWLCFPVAFFIAGCMVMNSAKRKELQGSGFSWFCYGALIPIVSWIDVTMANSQSKFKGFMKGLAISITGIVAFLAVFVQVI